MTTMTANTMNVPVATAGAGRGTVGGLLGRLRTLLAERARYVRTREELAVLTDRELNDIGLLRSDIEDVAQRAARSAL